MQSRVKENIVKSAFSNAMNYIEQPDGSRLVSFSSWLNEIIWSQLSHKYNGFQCTITKENKWFFELTTCGGGTYVTPLCKDMNECIKNANNYIDKETNEVNE